MRNPDDMHFHPRKGKMLQEVLMYTSKIFSRGIVMGNLPKPVVMADDAEVFREEIISVDPEFQPLMTIMLTKRTTPEIIREAFKRGIRFLKYIPGNMSTNSEDGVPLSELHKYYPVFETMQELGMVLLGHWEFPLNIFGNLVPEFGRERQAIRYLDEIVKFFPRLIITVEHASTREMIEYVERAPANIVATLTVHHALLTYDDVCDGNGKIYNPHHYCKPIAKSSQDREAVVKAMISGNRKFFFGSDSAPHPESAKRKNPPAAGIFTAPVVLPLLGEIFEKNNALDILSNFVSRSGAESYDLPLNDGEITLKKEPWIVPEYVDGSDVRIFWGGKKLNWQVE